MVEEKQEGQKTVVSFVVGLLIGGLLVWAFSGPTGDVNNVKEKSTDSESSAEADDKTTEKSDDSTPVAEVEITLNDVEKPVLSVGEGKIVVTDQDASAAIALEAATYPVSEGWVGVRDYQNGQLGALLGVVRFSEAQGLVPTQVVLQRPTTAGREYAVVVYKENGDRQFNLAEDVQIDTIFATFTAK